VEQHSNLGGDLRAADHRHQRTLRVVERLVQGFQLRLHQLAGVSREMLRDADD